MGTNANITMELLTTVLRNKTGPISRRDPFWLGSHNTVNC